MRIGIKGKTASDLSFNERVALATVVTHHATIMTRMEARDSSELLAALTSFLARNDDGAYMPAPRVAVTIERNSQAAEELREYVAAFFPDLQFEFIP